jgi:sugar (pentulose or hexulose) kinase
MTPPGLLIGVDLGTTALKAAAFATVGGALLGCARRRLETRVDADGTREQDVGALRQALKEVFAELRAVVGEDCWQGVSGIGLAAQGGSGAVLRRSDGSPLTPLILWNDSRAAALLPEVAAARSSHYWRELSQRHGPGMGLARLLWLQRQRPGCLGPGMLYAGAGEVGYFLLTGVWRQDACNALQMGCYQVLEDRLDGEPLSLVGTGLEQVAPLRRGHATEPLGPAGAALLGLPAGLPVAGPYMDHEAGYLSAVGSFQSPLQCSLGTAWVGNFTMPQPRSGWSPVQLVIAAPTPGGGSLVIQPLLTGNVSWDWGLNSFVDADQRLALLKVAEVFAERLLPPAGMTCIPWLTQANPWAPGLAGGGVFAGVSPQARPEDFVRALALGLCCEFYRVFRELKERGVVDGIVLGGGASKGAFFRTLLAALFAPLPVVQCADEDVGGARGALAAFAGAVSHSQSIPVAAPDSAQSAAIRRCFEGYAATFAATYGWHPLGAPYRLTGAAHGGAA